MKMLRLAALVVALVVVMPRPASARVVYGGNVSPDGAEELTIDLPVDLLQRNVGGTDGAGLCVFTSITYAARYANEGRLWDFQDRMKLERGGGWPEKVDAMILKYGPGTPYLQVKGASLDVLRLALRTGRMPCVTWNGNHMVSLVHLSERWAAIRDNNNVGPNEIKWCSPSEFERLFAMGGGGRWCVILLAGRPPAPPLGPPRPTPPPARELLYVSAAPAAGLEAELGERDGDPPGGVRIDKVAEMPDGFFFRGEQVGREKALALMSGPPQLEDDADRPSFSVIGPADRIQRAKQDWETSPLLQPFHARVVPQFYTPSNWAVARFGHVTTGNPTYYVQEAGGYVLHRSDAYLEPAQLADALSRALELAALRKKDPSYDPSNDMNVLRVIRQAVMPSWVPWVIGAACTLAGLSPVALVGLYVAIRAYRTWSARAKASLDSMPVVKVRKRSKPKQAPTARG